VQLQPGQSRSGQAGSECCHSSGDWRVRSVHSEEAGREDSAPKTFHHCDADAVSLAQGRMRATDSARLPAVAGVPSPGHAFKETPREPRRAPYLSRNLGVLVPPNPNWNPVPGERGSPHGKRTNPRRGEPCCQGRPEGQAWVDEQSYEPIVPMKVENRRAPERGGHGIHWREGANR
jgi:hypothetical protein